MRIEQVITRLWHAAAPDEALAALATGKRGLSGAEVEARRRTFGPNSLPRPKRASPVEIYLRQFLSPLIYLLLAAAVVSVFIGEYLDTVFIVAVLQINAVIGAVQERKAESSAEALGRMVRNRVTVRRDGERALVDSAELVPGDIALLESGTVVPADIRLLGATDLEVDESLLTGESRPPEKDAGVVLPEHTVVGDRRNMLHAGTTVANGRAEGVVVRTGAHTELGRIAQVLTATKAAPPPLVLRLQALSRMIGILVVGAVAVLAFAELLRGTDLAEIFFVSVALVVSAIPEGLPVAITVALSVGSVRMARRNVIVRSLPAVEGLGACTVIASDKTGTLTRNQLTIKRLVLADGTALEVTGEGYNGDGRITRDGAAPAGPAADAARRLAMAGALCNEGTLRRRDGGYEHLGDTVDVAFLALAAKAGVDREALIDEFPELGTVPFEPQRRYAASFNRSGDRCIALVKGAPEVVVAMCDGLDRDAVMAAAADLATAGYRVLAVASGEVTAAVRVEEAAETLRNLELLGLVGLIDPVRGEVPDAVDRSRAAGVDVRMVTGDHPATALAISRQLGIAEADDEVVTGVELSALEANQASFDAAVGTARTFARVEPLQKLDIVRALQRLGHFVAVTGDGANDAPALRTANIGVAMGKDGTDVARGAADLILADDNFASIVGGIEEGRVAYDNVRKIVYLLVSTGAAEIIVFFLALVAGLPLPLFAVQLLWLNLVTNGLQHVALAFEKGEPGILGRRPRPPDEPVFDRRMIEQTALSGAVIGAVAFGFFWWALEAGWSEDAARNALLMLMVLFENAHVFNCRSETRSVFRVPFAANPFLVAAVVGVQALHIGASYVPGLSDVLRIQPIDAATWLAVVPLALALIAVMELYKLWLARVRATASR